MSDTKFTPGPWKCEGRTVYALIHRGWCKGVKQFQNRFTAYVQDAHTNTEELEANARLIAAAPDMYEALKEALSVIRHDGHETGVERDAYGLIEMAIAKAEGKV